MALPADVHVASVSAHDRMVNGIVVDRFMVLVVVTEQVVAPASKDSERLKSCYGKATKG